jgi:hypothetical protein
MEKKKEDIGKKIWTTVLPAGKKTLSMVRHERGLILRKNKNEIIIEPEEVSQLNWCLLKFSREYKDLIKFEEGGNSSQP